MPGAPGRGGLSAACLVGLLAAGPALAGAAPKAGPGAAPPAGERLRVEFVQEVPGVHWPIRSGPEDPIGVPSSAWLIPAGLGAGMAVGGAIGSDVWRDYPVSRWIGDLKEPAR